MARSERFVCSAQKRQKKKKRLLQKNVGRYENDFVRLDLFETN